MLVTLKDRTMFGWGAHARELPENAAAYGSRMLSDEQAKELVAAIRAKKWRPFWKKAVTERVVFLVNPAANWRQSITAHGYEGCTLQVVEEQGAEEDTP